ncbi:unnamed protein product [Schistosoma turkestanicum]|nr:unnamed protein product [Schistosoma turkestanicum]
MKGVVIFSLLVIASCILADDSYTPYSGDNNGAYHGNGDYNNNNNDFYNSGGDKNHGGDNHGRIHTRGKFIAFGNADKGLKYHQVTYFHKGSKSRRKFANYDTKGKVHTYGRQNVKAKFNIESKLSGRSKFNGGKLDYMVGPGGPYGETNKGQIPIDNIAYGGGSDYNTPSNYDNNNNNNNNEGNGEGSANDYGYSSGSNNDNYQS